MFRNPALLVYIFLSLTGCASASKTYDANGKAAHALNCSGTARNWGMCYEKAGSICGTKGYEVVEKSGDQGWVVGGSANGVAGGSTISRTMTIRCKD